MAASDGKTAGEAVSLPPGQNLEKASKWMGDATNLLAGSPSSSNSRFGLTQPEQLFPNLPETFQDERAHEQLRAFGRGSFSSSIPDESLAAPGAEKAALNPPAGKRTASRVLFWSLQGIMFASVVASVESTNRCLDAGSCAKIPTQFKSRAALYNIGIPVSVGISVLSYEMRKHGNHWWFLPPAIITAGASVLTVHGVRASD